MKWVLFKGGRDHIQNFLGAGRKGYKVMYLTYSKAHNFSQFNISEIAMHFTIDENSLMYYSQLLQSHQKKENSWN